MTFRRSSSGLKNQPIFFESEVVAYVEGEFPDAPDGSRATNSDSQFWRAVIEAVVTGIKVHFKALGAKQNLIEFASSLDEKALGRVIVCMDRDLGDFDPSNVSLPCTAVTLNYSWEADVWSIATVEGVVLALAAVDQVPQAALEECQSAEEQFFRTLRKFTILDVKLHFTRSVPAFFPRESPVAPILFDGKDVPTPNRAFFRARVRTLRGLLPRPWSIVLPLDVDTRRHTFGKTVGAFYCRLAAFLLRRLDRSSVIAFELLTNLVLREFGVLLRDPVLARQNSYYRVAISDALGIPR